MAFINPPGGGFWFLERRRKIKICNFWGKRGSMEDMENSVLKL